MKERLLIIGNGMASGRLMEYLLEADADRYDITVFNAEPRVNYNRLELSRVLSGEKSYPDIITHEENWYTDHGIRLLMSTPVETINTDEQWVRTARGRQFDYDRLVIATGSNPIMIPLPGHTLQGVQAYRDLDDVDYMLNVTRNPGRAVVMGGGLPGLEAAAGLRKQGMDVCVVHLGEHLMENQLDSNASFLLRKELEQRGIEVRTATRTIDIMGDSQVQGLRFADGSETACELLVMAMGSRPSTHLARQASLAVNRGILVDDAMRTSADKVYALGECVEHQDKCHGVVAPLYDMARVLASTLTDRSASFRSKATATRLKVNDVDVYSAGQYLDSPADSGLEEIILRDATAGIYKRLVVDGQRLVGIVLYGDTSDAAWYFDMLQRGTDISELRDMLIFGQAFQEGATLDAMAAVAALADDTGVCDCHGSGKGAIMQAVKPVCDCMRMRTGVDAGMNQGEVRTRTRSLAKRRLSIPIE